MKKIYLILQNGRIFEGRAFGAEGRVCGELVFATGVTGYLQSLSDPGYYGQILVQTFPLIGNYGVVEEELESNEVYVSAYVVREICDDPSNYRCKGKLDAWLKEKGVVGICGIDTRALTAIIREYGVMNAIITDTLPEGDELPDELLCYSVKDAVSSVSCKEKTVYTAENAKLNVALYDFGIKKSTVEALCSRGCNVTVLPYNTPASDILDAGFDGVLLAGGPGDPKDNAPVVVELRKLLGKLPMFGINLGHQLLALAAGASTTKLKYGHRGSNQPVKDLDRGHCCITSQNHGYVVDGATLPEFAHVSYANVNDDSIEGIDYIGKNAFSVQFDPLMSGTKESRDLYAEFISMMEKGE